MSSIPICICLFSTFISFCVLVGIISINLSSGSLVLTLTLALSGLLVNPLKPFYISVIFSFLLLIFLFNSYSFHLFAEIPHLFMSVHIFHYSLQHINHHYFKVPI